MSNSLLTHVLEGELENYIQESYRLLKPGGAIMHSHFNLDYPPATYGTRHTFQHALGNSRVELLEQPEAAVAYRTDYLFKVARTAASRIARSCICRAVPSTNQSCSARNSLNRAR